MRQRYRLGHANRGSHAMISFHGETVAELRAEFETAIEEFLRD